jgi:inhibitor of cysteine peptidase
MVMRTRRFGQVLVVMLVVALVALAGCSSDSSDSKSDSGDSGDSKTVTPKNGSTVDATVGKDFVIKLESNPTTGYEWAVKGTPENVTFISSNYQKPSSDAMGAPGQQLLTFKATKAGSWPVALVYERPFDKTEPGKSMDFTVDAKA